MGQLFHDVGTHPHAPFREEKEEVEEPMREVSGIFDWLRSLSRTEGARRAPRA